MAELQLQTGVGVFEVLAQVCRSPFEALKQFVENAADAIELGSSENGRIAVHLNESEKVEADSLKTISVEDNGIGMSREKMQQIVRQIGSSEKLNSTLRGEKGIGILAFSLIAEELHLASNDGSGPSGCLVLRREELRSGVAHLEEQCPLHSQTKRGTRAYLIDIRPQISSLFTRGRIREYLGREFAHDLKQGLYVLALREGHHSETVSPGPSRGISIFSSPLALDSIGQVTVQLYALPVEVAEAAICLYGRGGTRVCNLTELEAFQKEPWQNRQLEGFIYCDHLKRSADKTAVVQDETYGALVQALSKLEPYLYERIRQVTQEYRQQRLMEVLEKVDRFIARFLRHADDDRFFQPPLRLLPTDGEKGMLPSGNGKSRQHRNGNGHSAPSPVVRERPHLLDVDLCAPSEDKTPLRSWSDGGQVIHINELHRDFLRSQWDDKRWAWYLFTLWAKERALSEHPTDSSQVAEEMAGLLGCAGPIMNQYLQRL